MLDDVTATAAAAGTVGGPGVGGPGVGGPGVEELRALRDSVRGICARAWPTARDAQTGDLGALWTVAAGQGWTDFGDPAYASAAVAVQDELGRVACPLPVVDSALVAMVALAAGEDAVAAGIADATVRAVIATGTISADGTVVARHVEVASAATHLLLVDVEAATLSWYGLASATVTEELGLAKPAWSEVRLTGAPAWVADLGGHPDLLLLRRIGLAARALAAVGRTHELAVAHAGAREQFGKLIGSFQAVSHRLVNTEIALGAAAPLAAHAFALRSRRDPAWPLAAEIYLQFVSERAAQLQFASHHTLAASGYFEDHDAPWLFRRAHADLAALSVGAPRYGVGDQLVDAGAALPDFDREPHAEAIRTEVLDAFAAWTQGPPSHLGSWDDDARALLRDRGWIGVGWPKEMGGGAYSAEERAAFSEAIAYADPPLGNIWMGINSIAPMLMKVGPPELRDLVLEEIRVGNLSIALGYSEPEAGSDLASLRTKATRTAGGWRIDGQKMWGTCVPDSKWILLAARTDPEARPVHAGISLFLVDLDSPGITVVPHRSLAGDVSATTFWDDVFVPDDRLVGAENQGWSALTVALAAERMLIGASVMRARRAFDRLVRIVRTQPDAVVPARRMEARAVIGRLGVALQAARGLVDTAARALASGEGPRPEASMAKIAATELAEDLNATAVALLGPAALLGWGVDGGVGDGYFDQGLRASIMGVVAGGTGDIQRNLVARSMGLPR